MAWGAAQYQDVTEARDAAGLDSEFIKTGGMNAATLVPIGSGHYALITHSTTPCHGIATTTPDGCGLYEPEE